MANINIQFTRFSAFYTPLIFTKSGGFLKDEGLDAFFAVANPGKSAIDALMDGSAQLVQSALFQGLSTIEKGQKSKGTKIGSKRKTDRPATLDPEVFGPRGGRDKGREGEKEANGCTDIIPVS